MALRKADFLISSPDYPDQVILRRGCLLVKDLRRPLLSIPALTMDGYIVVFTGTTCTLLSPSENKTCLIIDRRTKSGLTPLFEIPLSYFQTDDLNQSVNLASTYMGADIYTTWHNRLGHANAKRIMGLFPASKFGKTKEDCICNSCITSKIHKTKFPKSSKFIAPHIGHTFSVDTAGPFRIRDPFGNRYFTLAIDIKSKYTTFISFKRKSELASFIISHVNMVERMQQPKKVVMIMSDGALNETNLVKWIKDRGITLYIVAPNSSRLNGHVERSIRTICESGRAMMTAAGLPPTFYLLACREATRIKNLLAVQSTKLSTTGRPLSPLEEWEGRDHGSIDNLLSNLRTFGCLCYRLRGSDKQSSKGERCIMLGAAFDNPNAYLLMSLERKSYFTSRDVVCNETSFPFKREFQISRSIPTSYARGDPGETSMREPPGQESEFQDVTFEDLPFEDHLQEPSTADNRFEDSTHERVEVPHEEHEDDMNDEAPQEPRRRLRPRRLDQLFEEVEDEPEQKHDNDAEGSDYGAETTPNPPPQLRLRSLISAPPTDIKQEDNHRATQGTGDVNPGPRSTPSTFKIGGVYDSVWDQPAQIVKNNHDGDVQVLFPMDKSPTKLWTVDKEELLGPAEAEINIAECILEPKDVQNILNNPLDWQPIYVDGLLLPSCDFSTRFDTPYGTANLAQQHGGFTNKTDMHVAYLTSSDLVGKVLADTLDIPKYHFTLKNHPLRSMVEEAMWKELNTLIRLGVFSKGRKRQPGDKVVPTMFVSRAKGDAKGMLEKIKSRLTVRGDLENVTVLSYSPMMLLSTMRMILAKHAADLEIRLHQLDVTAAFVSARTKRDIKVTLPDGFHPEGDVNGLVYTLIYNLYGTTDSARAFYEDYFKFHVEELGFETIHADNCYLRKTDPDGSLIEFCTHVDDSLIAQKGQKLWDWYLAKMTARYEYRVAPLSYFLGMAFERNAKTGAISIDQNAQVEKMLRVFNLAGKTKRVSTPVAADSGKIRPSLADIPTDAEGKAKAAKFPVPQAIGHLGFLQQCTHFEITYPLKVASRFIKEWSDKVWAWVKHIMLHLKGKEFSKLIFHGDPTNQQKLSAYCDSDHITDVDTRRSISGFAILLGQDVIDWHASFQTMVSHSSAESELMAIDLCVRRLVATRWKLEQITKTIINLASSVHIDCESAITMSENPIQNNRNCHIHARYFYVRDLINDRVIKLEKISTQDQLADILVTFKTVANFRKLISIMKPQL